VARTLNRISLQKDECKMKLEEVSQQLADVVTPKIKDIANGDHSDKTISTLVRLVDGVLYRSFGDEDIITNNDLPHKVKELKGYFKKIHNAMEGVFNNLENGNDSGDETVDNFIEQAKENNVDFDFINDEDNRSNIKFSFVMMNFMNKLMSFCISKYEDKFETNDSGYIKIPISKSIVKEYKKTKDLEKLKASLRELISNEIEKRNIDDFPEEQIDAMIKAMLDDIISCAESNDL
jgi:hypothetical protein